MIRQDEVFFQVLEPAPHSPHKSRP
jgi:hypothetical protein